MAIQGQSCNTTDRNNIIELRLRLNSVLLLLTLAPSVITGSGGHSKQRQDAKLSASGRRMRYWLFTHQRNYLPI